jgi:hypothetical protein
MEDYSDKRSYVRRKLALLVRFITRSQLEGSGRLFDISEGGLFMESDVKAAVGDEIIVYPEGLGRLTGHVARTAEGGIAVQFNLNDAQKEYLSKKIESSERGMPYLKLMEQRMHRRVEIKVDSRAVMQDCGSEFDCTIVDLSLTGARLLSVKKPPIGSEVRIGALRGQVMRQLPDGFAIQFILEEAA